MNSVCMHTFDKSGALPVRILFSAAGATIHVRPLGALPCAPPSDSSRAAFAVRALSVQFERCLARAVADRELLCSSATWELLCSSSAARPQLCSSRAAFATGVTQRRSDVRPLGSLGPRLLQLESCCAVRALPDPSRAVRALLWCSSAADSVRESPLRLEPLHVRPLGSPVAWRLFYAHVQQALARNNVVLSIFCCDVALSIVFLCVLNEGYGRLFVRASYKTTTNRGNRWLW